MAFSLVLTLALFAALVAYGRRWLHHRREIEQVMDAQKQPQSPPRRPSARPGAPGRLTNDGSPFAAREQPAMPAARARPVERLLQPLFVNAPGEHLMVDALLAAPPGDPSKGQRPAIPATLLLSTRTHPLVAAAGERLLQEWADNGEAVTMQIDAGPDGVRARLSGPRSAVTLELEDVSIGNSLG